MAYLPVRPWFDGRILLQECPYVDADAALAVLAQLGRDPAGVSTASPLSGRLPRDHVLGCAGQWSVHEDTMTQAYTAAGAERLDALRGPAMQRSVYWSGDGF